MVGCCLETRLECLVLASLFQAQLYAAQIAGASQVRLAVSLSPYRDSEAHNTKACVDHSALIANQKGSQSRFAAAWVTFASPADLGTSGIGFLGP